MAVAAAGSDWVCVMGDSLFEIFMALKLQAKQGSSCKLEIIMPPSEEASFRRTLLTVRAARRSVVGVKGLCGCRISTRLRLRWLEWMWRMRMLRWLQTRWQSESW